MENEVVFSLKNQDKGFSPVRAGSNRIVDTQDQYRIAGAYGTDIFSGQPVFQFTDGNVRVLSKTDEIILGVFNGVWYVDSQGDTIFRPYWPASTALQTGSVATANIFAADGLFQIGADADTLYADTENYVDLTPTTGTGGSTVTGRATVQVDYSQLDATLQTANVVRIVERSQQPGNVRLLIVKFARPVFNGIVGS